MSYAPGYYEFGAGQYTAASDATCPKSTGSSGIGRITLRWLSVGIVCGVSLRLPSGTGVQDLAYFSGTGQNILGSGLEMVILSISMEPFPCTGDANQRNPRRIYETKLRQS